MAQQTDEWFAKRLGKATASKFKDVMATIKTGEAATRRNYRVQLVVERLTGKKEDSYTNAAMTWGNETEPLARIAYECRTGLIVEQVDFVDHPHLMAGASPDGLIGEDGGLEIKCPHQSAVHVETIQSGMPSEHMAQVQGAMWITGRKWWDFVSYDPRMPEHLQLYVQRIERDDKYIADLESKVTVFLREVESTIKQLNERAA